MGWRIGLHDARVHRGIRSFWNADMIVWIGRSDKGLGGSKDEEHY